MNAEWHKRHRLARNAAIAERIEWHREHQEQCACRPIPTKLVEQMRPAASLAKGEDSRRTATREPKASGVDPRFAPVVAAFVKDRQVTYGGKGFGSAALKVKGKIFAMLSSKGQFVAKLPKERVDELVRLGKGEYFDSGHGRLMKEWISLAAGKPSWVELAREARGFVSGEA